MGRKRNENKKTQKESKEEVFPKQFPFWARLKISKSRPTLVIDEKQESNKKTQKMEDMFVHREVTHTKGHGELITPNPQKDDTRNMYLKSPRVLPKRLFKPHNKNWEVPNNLKERYDKKE